MPYNVYLMNGLGIQNSTTGSFLSANQLLSIAQTLQNYFQRVVNAHDASGGTRLGTASARWLAGTPAIAPTELLIYLMPYGATLVKSRGTLKQGQPPLGHDGYTGPIGSSSGSEVYFHFSDTTLLANLMFHEAMHNKLALSDKQLHPRGALASATVDASMTISPSNISDMAAGLDQSRPQWTAGVGILDAEAARPDSDPLKGIF
jgi:hypothetical protein